MSRIDYGNTCDCSCHEWEGIRHCLPCCAGQCHICSKYVKSFEIHSTFCAMTEDPISRMCREIEEREMDWKSIYAEAVEIATKAHKDQTRWDKSIPYITHPLAVAANFELGPEKVVAIMHDVLEDTDVTEARIRGTWPDRVVDALVCMTHDPKVSYTDYIMKIRNNELARRVKAADIRDNLKGLGDKKHKQRRDKYELALKLLELS